MKVRIAFDDHDSPIYGCTTHFTALFIEEIRKWGKVRLLDFPYLVRLNPNIPWKTRGNGSTMIVVDYRGELDELLDLAWNASLEYVEEVSKAKLYDRKPGVAVGIGDPPLFELYKKAVSDVVTLDYAFRLASKLGILVRGDRGVIGALAAMGFSGPYTYELLAYRRRENWGRFRRVDPKSVKLIDVIGFPHTFSNYDYVESKPLIMPHGNDPVFYGIRGTDPALLERLAGLIVSEEKPDFSRIFKTNQSTDAHLLSPRTRPYSTFDGIVEVKEVKREGKDVNIWTSEGMLIFVFKETGELNQAASLLESGDVVRVIGAVKPSSRYGRVIEAERFKLISLRRRVSLANPRCPICGGSSESAGRGKGFRCRKCGHSFSKEKVEVERSTPLSLSWYYSRPLRHLSRPIFLRI
jgi:tRNA(Ile2)-agmatinylcytidine synthase